MVCMHFFESCVQYMSCSSGGTRVRDSCMSAIQHELGRKRYETWCSSLKGVAGCSAGCFTALAILLGVSFDDLHNSFPVNNLMSLTVDLQNSVSKLGAAPHNIIVEVVELVLYHGGLSSSVTLEHLYRFTRKECVFVCTSLTRCQRVHLTHRRIRMYGSSMRSRHPDPSFSHTRYISDSLPHESDVSFGSVMLDGPTIRDRTFVSFYTKECVFVCHESDVSSALVSMRSRMSPNFIILDLNARRKPHRIDSHVRIRRFIW